jgi:hypothetical protein
MRSRGKSVEEIADDAIAWGRRARGAAVLTVLAVAIGIAWDVLDRPYDLGVAVSLSVAHLVGAVVGGRAVWHGFHYGHAEGRGAGIVALLPSGFGILVVWAAVVATGGRRAGAVTGITRRTR